MPKPRFLNVNPLVLMLKQQNRSPYAAHPNQKDLIDSHNSPLSAEKAARAYREINRKARRDGMDKYMKENDVDLIVASSDCTLVIWAADAGKWNDFEVGLCWRGTGYPSATVPLGNLENSYPYVFFLLARAGREDLIFRFMSDFETTFPKVNGPFLE